MKAPALLKISSHVRYVLLRCPKFLLVIHIAKFRPLLLLIPRCIRHRRRSETSPLRYVSEYIVKRKYQLNYYKFYAGKCQVYFAFYVDFKISYCYNIFNKQGWDFK